MSSTGSTDCYGPNSNLVGSTHVRQLCNIRQEIEILKKFENAVKRGLRENNNVLLLLLLFNQPLLFF